MDDVLVIGGGVIGLSLAYELARQGQRVRVVERGSPGQEASWAGAGILPPALTGESDDPLMPLIKLSYTLHAQWAQRLREQTGIDTGYQCCGGLYLAHDDVATAELRQIMHKWQQSGVASRWLAPTEIQQLEPELRTASLAGACLLPGECQVRNPRHLKALLVACTAAGVAIQSAAPIDDFSVRQGRVEAALSGGQPLQARSYCITSGAWTQTLLARLGRHVPIKPIRGQIVLLSSGRRVLKQVINDGHRYLVPRHDGRILVGSTEEDAGFDKRNTAEAISRLLNFAVDLAPALADHAVERTWAGLRPCSIDGLPYLGQIPGLENAFIAAGHYRQGLHLSPATAVVMSELLRGEKPQVDLAPFRIERG